MDKFKKDYECILRDVNTGKDLLTLYAQQVGLLLAAELVGI